MKSSTLKYLSLLIAFCVVFFSNTNAQDDSLFRFLKKIEYPISSFAVDNLGELYLINTDNQLKKYDAKGDSIGVFNQVTKYGKLTYVEAQNPWKAILFYQNFSTIVLLDKYLNVLGNINLRSKNIFRVRAVTTSYDNNIWLFDEQDNKLKKIDDSGNLLSESVDFRLIFDSVPSPQKIIDYDGFIYLYDPLKGLYLFDYYGSFKIKLTFLNWTYFSVIGKSVYGFDEQNLYKYTPPLPDVVKYKLPVGMQNSNSIKLSNYKIYILKDQQLQIYSLQ
ncbi:MAG: hypothetical protein ABI172_04440 [Ginsengibacter sp.]